MKRRTGQLQEEVSCDTRKVKTRRVEATEVSSDSFNLVDLDKELLYLILFFLDAITLLKCRAVCKSFCSAIDGSTFWREYLIQSLSPRTCQKLRGIFEMHKFLVWDTGERVPAWPPTKPSTPPEISEDTERCKEIAIVRYLASYWTTMILENEDEDSEDRDLDDNKKTDADFETLMDRGWSRPFYMLVPTTGRDPLLTLYYEASCHYSGRALPEPIDYYKDEEDVWIFPDSLRLQIRETTTRESESEEEESTSYLTFEKLKSSSFFVKTFEASHTIGWSGVGEAWVYGITKTGCCVGLHNNYPP